jgi:hypothetical protein
METMNHVVRTCLLMCALALSIALAVNAGTTAQNAGPGRQSTPADSVSFAQDVFPIIERRCLPCHAEVNYNPSELSLNSYELLMEGGRHGKTVVPGDSVESTLILKLRADPPFGHQMPLVKRKTKGTEPTVAPLDEEEIQTIATWIAQGAKDN